ncbi:MAG: hypothetical protein CMH52_04990 [Myxococcales bacterium]|nr:hypothetical protein [Myxococcales bacterium]
MNNHQPSKMPRLYLTLLLFGCLACTPGRRHAVVAFDTPSQVAGDAGLSIKDLGHLSIVDSGLLGGAADANYGVSFQWNRRVLLLDMSLSSPTGWTQLSESFREADVDFTYRHHFPYLTTEDIDGRYGGIILSLGSGPEYPDPHLRDETFAQLQTFLGRGGSLMVLTTHAWQDSLKGSNDRAIINGLLDAHSGQVRIDANTIVGQLYGTDSSGSPALHTSLPWAYVTPSDPARAGAIGFVPHPDLEQRETTFALGLAASLSCEAASIRILAESHMDTESWTTLSGDSVPSTSQNRPIAVQLKLINGQILLAPRSIFNLPFHSARDSMQPVLEPSLTSGTKAASESVLSAWLTTAQTKEIVSGAGCFVRAPSDTVTRSENEPRPRQDTQRTQDAPPEPPAWASIAAQQPVEVAAPNWVATEKIRLVSGGLPTDGALYEYFERAQLAKMQGYIADINPSILLMHADSGQHSQRLLKFGEAAVERQQLAFVSARFANDLYDQQPALYGQIVGPHSQYVMAPPPLSKQWWQNVIRPMVLSAAELSALSPGIRGLVLDLSLDRSPTGHYENNHAFDDDTWSYVVEAIEAHDQSVADALGQLPVADRMNTLLALDLLAFAYDSLEKETARQVRELLDDCRAIDPTFELLLKSSSVQHSWFYRGFYRGVGRPERPVVLLSYTCCQPKALTDLRQWGYSIIGLSGLVARRIQPTDIQAALLNAVTGSRGYWIAQYEDFTSDNQTVLDLYWSALLRVNSELDHR